ncbi:MAG: class II aldolase/adducin family protein [Betaproteobacteria bacterium]
MSVNAPRVAHARYSPAEWKQRVDLAACYRLADRYRMGKVIWNHITARIPDAPDEILVFALGCRYDEVTASNLVKVSLDGTVVDGPTESLNFAAYVIHGGIYAARPEVMCVMHTHSRGGQAVACLEEGLLPLSQEAMMFHGDTAYHAYEGISDDTAESDRLAADLADKHQMILRSHGLMTVGQSVGEAFWRMYMLEMACALQIDVLSTGRPYILQPPDVCANVRAQYERDFFPGRYEWPAFLRYLDRVDPDYAS